jgi:MFS family permease
MLGLLLLIYAFNATDRLALGLVLQDIKLDLALSDTQLGFLSGLAFALFYSVMGIPIARWADRGNRVRIIALTAILWSLMVAACGFAKSFTQLWLARVGVAIGEAGCVPPAHSLIADHYERAERPRALAIYMLGSSLGVAIGYFFAGWINELYGWRATFWILSWPGAFLGLVAWRTLREPRVAGDANIHKVASAVESPGFAELRRTLWGNRTFRHLLMCFSVISFFGYGIGQWQATFFIRSFGLKTGELGAWLGLIYGVGGILGTWLGGEAASRYASNNERLQLRAMAVLVAGFGLLYCLIYMSTNRYVALSLLALSTLSISAIIGPLFATIQTLVPARMRAMSIALIYFFANLVGMGLGPLVAGALSDALNSWVGPESLRYSLLAFCPGYAWGAWHLWRAADSVTCDLLTAATQDPSPEQMSLST